LARGNTRAVTVSWAENLWCGAPTVGFAWTQVPDWPLPGPCKASANRVSVGEVGGDSCHRLGCPVIPDFGVVLSAYCLALRLHYIGFGLQPIVDIMAVFSAAQFVKFISAKADLVAQQVKRRFCGLGFRGRGLDLRIHCGVSPQTFGV
jgi:hypothetical protein